MKQTLENFVATRTVDLFKNSEIFDQKLIAIRTRMGQIQQSIKAQKAADPNLGFEAVKSELSEFHQLHYDSHLMEQEFRRLATGLIENYSMSKLFQLDLNLPEDKISILDQLLANSSGYIFAVEKGEVRIANEEIYKAATLVLESERNNDKFLSDAFLSPIFTN